MDSWYFAYGSNLLIDQMIERTGAIGRADQPPRIARLAYHRLVFQPCNVGGPAFANILCPGDGVLGIIYRCQAVDLDKLDTYEAGYERRRMTVVDLAGDSLEAVAYVMQLLPSATTGVPTAAYLDRIVRGARHHGFPEEYISQIISTASLGGTV
jgi:gamma-glutamylcyclotransferase (GGCT)/AIG2-like uncharacterized protein YtfP